MMGNVCNSLTYGDRLLDLSTAQVRQVKITLTSDMAVQPGEVGYQSPAQPIGTVLNSVRLMNKCTCLANLSMYTMTPGSIIYCPMHLKFTPFPGASGNYVLGMGNDAADGSEKVQITCLASGSDGHCARMVPGSIHRSGYHQQSGENSRQAGLLYDIPRQNNLNSSGQFLRDLPHSRDTPVRGCIEAIG